MGVGVVHAEGVLPSWVGVGFGCCSASGAGKWAFLNAVPLCCVICSDMEQESQLCWQEQLAGRVWGSHRAFAPQGVA